MNGIVKRFQANYRYNPEHEEKKSFDEFVASTPDEVLEEVFDVKNADNILLYRKPVMWKMIRFADELRKQQEDYWEGPKWKAEEKKDSGCFFCTNGDVYDLDQSLIKTVHVGKCECHGGTAKPSQFVIDTARAGGYDCVRAACQPVVVKFHGLAQGGKLGLPKDEMDLWNAATIKAIKEKYEGVI